MKISISREGVEIGEWSKDDICALYHKGTLIGTDYYWHEGMTEWKPLLSFLKPPPPKPLQQTSTESTSKGVYSTSTEESISLPKPKPSRSELALQYAILGTTALGFGFLITSLKIHSRLPEEFIGEGIGTALGISLIPLILASFRKPSWKRTMICLAGIFFFALLSLWSTLHR